MNGTPDDEANAEWQRSDRAFALEVINDILNTGNQAELLFMLRRLALAHGGVRVVAERARINPNQLYRTLSPKGNPALSTLSIILKAMGLRLAILRLSEPDAPTHVDDVS